MSTDEIKMAAAELAEVAGLEDEEQIQGQKFTWRNDLTKWAQCKEQMQKQVTGNLNFIGHNHHKITGKPQLINQNMQQITFMSRVCVDDGKELQKLLKKFSGKIKLPDSMIIPETFEVRVLGESIDKRKEVLDRVLSEYVWVYRVISNNKEYTVLSFQELGTELTTLTGMNIRMNMPTEVSKLLSLKGYANVFIAQSAEPAIKALSKVELVNLTKKLNLTQKDFIGYLFAHPNKEVYAQPEEYMQLRAVQLLSGKFEGYPLHCLTMGPPGTGKTMEAEALDDKFGETILEAGNSRPKALVPSFKENPATPGYILSCNRFAIVDELMKMVEAAAVGTRQQESVQNLLAQLNMLLEQKLRTIGSGNANFMKAKATAKCFFVTNPFSAKRTLADHTIVIDRTVLSRVLPYCQDEKHIEFIKNQKSGNTSDNYDEKSGNTTANNNRQQQSHHLSSLLYYTSVTTKLHDVNDFLSIIDGSNIFIVSYDISRIKIQYQTILKLLNSSNQGEILKGIFEPRGLHHLILLFDGLVKLRCLFQDYDPTFAPIEADYDSLEKLIVYVVSTWDADFSEIKGMLGGQR